MNEAFSNLLKKPWVIPVSVGVISAGAGASIGYLFGVKRTASVMDVKIDEFQEWMHEVIHELDEDSEEPESDEVDEIVLHDLSDLKDVITEEGYFDYSKDVAMPEDEEYAESGEDDTYSDVIVIEPEDGEAYSPEIEFNVFSESSDDWDYNIEDRYREENPDGPYVLHEDEYIRNDLGFRQETLTYYLSDDILADESGTPVYNYSKLTGALRFGHGSNDENIVYIRNSGIRMEWEILRHSGWYTKEVHGIDIEDSYENEDLRHENAPRKFRGEY
jgi:hypothetical protein